MGFVKISVRKYVKLHLRNNPSENKTKLELRLYQALKDYNNGVKCSCGNDIWVIGSAVAGNSCYSCITGESTPSGDYEIDSAINKRQNIKRGKHIDDMDPDKIFGFFDDDGYKINMDLIKKPDLCLICIHDNNPRQEFLCNMNRNDQKNHDEFKCNAFKNK